MTRVYKINDRKKLCQLKWKLGLLCFIVANLCTHRDIYECTYVHTYVYTLLLSIMLYSSSFSLGTHALYFYKHNIHTHGSHLKKMVYFLFLSLFFQENS